MSLDSVSSQQKAPSHTPTSAPQVIGTRWAVAAGHPLASAAASRVLAEQYELRRQASVAADQVEQQVLNRYRAGQVSYSEVVTAQATALNTRRAMVQLAADRQTTAVALIQALGGGWRE